MNAIAINQPNEDGELKRLPLWKSCAELLIQNGITYGSTYERKFFESYFKAPYDSWAYRSEMMCLTKFFREKSFVFTERGMDGKGYKVLENYQIEQESKSFWSYVSRAAHINLSMLSNTNKTGLDEEQRRKHEHQEEKTAQRMAAMKRAESLLRLEKESKAKKLK